MIKGLLVSCILGFVLLITTTSYVGFNRSGDFYFDVNYPGFEAPYFGQFNNEYYSSKRGFPMATAERFFNPDDTTDDIRRTSSPQLTPAFLVTSQTEIKTHETETTRYYLATLVNFVFFSAIFMAMFLVSRKLWHAHSRH